MKRKKKNDNNHNLVDCWFLFWLLSQRLVCSRTPNQSLQSKRASLLASLVALRSRLRVRRCCSFVAILIAIEHAKVHRNSRCTRTCMVHRNHCCDRTCSFARFIAIDVLARDPHRDRQKVVEQLSSLSTSSFASIVVIDVLDRIRDRRTRSRSSSRSTYSFAIIIVIDECYPATLVAVG